MASERLDQRPVRSDRCPKNGIYGHELILSNCTHGCTFAMKKSIPVANVVERILPASLVPTGRVLLNPQVLDWVRTSVTLLRSLVTEER